LVRAFDEKFLETATPDARGFADDMAIKIGEEHGASSQVFQQGKTFDMKQIKK
jgi:hypothetical protein